MFLMKIGVTGSAGATQNFVCFAKKKTVNRKGHF